jgi:hypothetical protein
LNKSVAKPVNIALWGQQQAMRRELYSVESIIVILETHSPAVNRLGHSKAIAFELSWQANV